MTEWKTYRLGEICDYVTSRTANIENYISTENMLPNKGGVCTPSNVPSGAAVEYKVGDILISNIRPYFQKIWQADCKGACSADVLCIRANNKADSKYLYYLLSQQLFFDYVMAGAKGCKMPRGDKKQIMQWQISLPSLEEQRRIAGILGAIDDKIENNRRINTNLELQAQAIFDEMFFSDNDWEYTTLGMLTEEVKTKVKGMSAKVLSPISSGELVLSEDYFTKQVYSQDISKYIVVEPMSFAYNPARINIGSIGINSFDFVGCVSPVYVVFKTKSEYENYFRLFVKSDIFKEDVKSRAIGGVRQTLSYHDFAMITTKHPPINSIRIFNTQYNTLLDIINHNNTENKTLTTLRDTLLPKLMNGEIKVAE